ncbi:DUF4350 domain-containing protein [Calothrix sp. PCC 7507]|uniref:DUF4350 domain-containing protein n=1 Tax=Calothrix sp. PCC 7507 TaxID=99598 RepID=UPI00029F306C|nr:DUF4350 domain-containing protein [Calothrix sp. PCC 7507]AFY34528.1 hypothetical protein Cal7507_4148 [Calothrix sp. PCC 7507]
MTNKSNRLAWLGAIALGVIILLSLIVAPSSNTINSGSTYNRAPDGYGAWYAFMQQQGIAIQRWQKPGSDLKADKNPVTLLRVYSELNPPGVDQQEREWLEQGNTLVILGVRDRVTAAEFSTTQKSSFGDVKIATRRRREKVEPELVSLGDRFGAIVWEEKYDKGKAIFSTTPHLAANAYQDYLSNFQYLANLVSQKNNQIFVDEYIHGYKDADVREKEGKGNLFSYFVQMPLFTALLQAGVLLLVLIWSQNRRFGKPVALDTPAIDNSEAYIQALAGVLQKAESTDFVVEMVGKEEQLQLQKALGLGQLLLEPQVLMAVWVEKTGLSAAELEAVLKLHARKKTISEQDLLSWLGKWRTLREQ